MHGATSAPAGLSAQAPRRPLRHHRRRHLPPHPWDVANPAPGVLHDLAVDGRGNAWVATDTQLKKINLADRRHARHLSCPPGGNGIVPAAGSRSSSRKAITLAGTPVPAGSLLVTPGDVDTDKVYAVNARHRRVLATLDVKQNLALGRRGSVRPGNLQASLFLLLGGSTGQIDAVDPATGQRPPLLHATPINVSSGALAIDPATGELWIGSDQTSLVSLVHRARRLDDPPGRPDALRASANEIDGLSLRRRRPPSRRLAPAFVYTLTLPPAATPAAGIVQPTITAIVATANDVHPRRRDKARRQRRPATTLVGDELHADHPGHLPHPRQRRQRRHRRRACPTAVSAGQHPHSQVVVPTPRSDRQPSPSTPSPRPTSRLHRATTTRSTATSPSPSRPPRRRPTSPSRTAGSRGWPTRRGALTMSACSTRAARRFTPPISSPGPGRNGPARPSPITPTPASFTRLSSAASPTARTSSPSAGSPGRHAPYTLRFGLLRRSTSWDGNNATSGSR